MKATTFEFRHRSLLNLIHIWISFQMYSFDRVNIVWMFVPWNTPRREAAAKAIFGFAALLAGIAAALRTSATAYLRSAVVHGRELHTDRLVASGPYRYVRNPLYLGTLLLCAGIGFLASRLGFVVLLAGAVIRILRLIGREESDLQREQSEAYAEFCRRVPRFLPALHARIPSSGVAPKWAQAFRGELFMWGFFIMMAGFAATLNDPRL